MNDIKKTPILNRSELHKTYAGEINGFDFAMCYHSMYSIGVKIARASAFDSFCHKENNNKIHSFRKEYL